MKILQSPAALVETEVHRVEETNLMNFYERVAAQSKSNYVDRMTKKESIVAVSSTMPIIHANRFAAVTARKGEGKEIFSLPISNVEIETNLADVVTYFTDLIGAGEAVPSEQTATVRDEIDEFIYRPRKDSNNIDFKALSRTIDSFAELPLDSV